MKRSIWKYILPIKGTQIIEMPGGSRLLTVQAQGGYPYLWVLVDPAAPLQQRHIQIYWTGYPADDAGTYIGTLQLNGGDLVLHVFEKK